MAFRAEDMPVTVHGDLKAGMASKGLDRLGCNPAGNRVVPEEGVPDEKGRCCGVAQFLSKLR